MSKKIIKNIQEKSINLIECKDEEISSNSASKINKSSFNKPQISFSVAYLLKDSKEKTNKSEENELEMRKIDEDDDEEEEDDYEDQSNHEDNPVQDLIQHQKSMEPVNHLMMQHANEYNLQRNLWPEANRYPWLTQAMASYSNYNHMSK